MPRKTNADWIPFEDGKYLVRQAYIVANDGAAIALEKPAIQITTGRKGRKQMQGTCLVRNLLVVDLLEDTDTLDILLDLGEEFTYLLEMPDIQAGKVFSPDVKSTLRFVPVGPWKQLSRAVFDDRLQRLRRIDDDSR